MRKFLLASVATLGTAGLTGAAFAQAPAAAPALPMNPVQGGFVSAPLASPPIGANNNNNKQAPMLPGAAANPTPGTVVVHFNGFVVTEFQSSWTSTDRRFFSAPAGVPGGAPITPGGTATGTAVNGTPPPSTISVLTPRAGVVGTGVPSGTPSAAAVLVGNTGAGPVKVMPQAIDSYGRLFAGVDGMATNGLRYGAGLEIRQNFIGQYSNTASSGASGYSSYETLFVRRAFTYAAGDNWGIVRVGQADGLISLFDSGVTTFQFLPTGNLNGGDVQNFVGGNSPPFVYLAVAGNEYDNAKAVYLSPQIAGFDFGIQYAPNTSNGEGISNANQARLTGSLSGSGIGTGQSCGQASTGCPTLSTGPGVQDGSRSINQWAFGGRYQGVFGPVGVLAYAVGEFSGHAQLSSSPNTLGLTNTQFATAFLGDPGASTGNFNGPGLPGGSRYSGTFKNLAIGSGGIALTWAGITFGGNFVGGNMNGQLGLQPNGGAPLTAYLLGVKYVNGPFTIGIVGEEMWMQGNVTLSGISQQRGRGLSTGMSYTVAPGFTVFGEYLWNDLQQTFNNFNSGANVPVVAGSIGSGSNIRDNNNWHAQGFLVGNIISF